MKNISILLVGCGKMGGAMLSGWLESGIDASFITVISPIISDEHIFDKVCYHKSFNELADDYFPDVILLAVKPQIISPILENYISFANTGSLFISIIAGKSIQFFKNILGEDLQIIRAMPNLPALDACGVTVLYADEDIDYKKRNLTKDLLSAIGTVHWVNGEDRINDVTAISGSGPAYLLYFMECFINSAMALGIDKKLATDLVIETIYGTAQIASKRNIDIAELRRNVTSPNGTTEAALKIFMEDGEFQKIINEAVVAAKKRAMEL